MISACLACFLYPHSASLQRTGTIYSAFQPLRCHRCPLHPVSGGVESGSFTVYKKKYLEQSAAPGLVQYAMVIWTTLGEACSPRWITAHDSAALSHCLCLDVNGKGRNLMVINTGDPPGGTSQRSWISIHVSPPPPAQRHAWFHEQRRRGTPLERLFFKWWVIFGGVCRSGFFACIVCFFDSVFISTLQGDPYLINPSTAS